MTSIRLRKEVALETLGLPSPVITRDAQQRITQMSFDYASVRVTLDVTWNSTTGVIDAFSRTVADL